MEDAIRELAEQLGVGTEMLVSMYVPFVQAKAVSAAAVLILLMAVAASMIAAGFAVKRKKGDCEAVFILAIAGAVLLVIFAVMLMLNLGTVYITAQAPEASAINEILERVASL